MYKLHFLRKENDLNKITRSYKKDRTPINIKEKYKDVDQGQPLYIVDSFRMPHSFVIYNTTKLPHLVRLAKKGIHSEDYLSMVMKNLRVV